MKSIGSNCFAMCLCHMDKWVASPKLIFRTGSKLSILSRRLFSGQRMTQLLFRNEISDLGDSRFSQTRFQSIRIRVNVQIIGEWSFRLSRELKEVLLMPTHKYIHSKGRHWESEFHSLGLPRRACVIGQNCFTSCPKLESVKFEDGNIFQHIGQNYFEHIQFREALTFHLRFRGLMKNIFHLLSLLRLI
jgi:hypothetical protein